MIYSTTILKTMFGNFKLSYHEFPNGDCVTLTKGKIIKDESVLVRIHSSCLFSETFHSIECDCAKQLHESLKKIVSTKKGIIVYLNQEGRGIGLKNKIKTMEHERIEKVDTIDAFKHFGYELDYRNYSPAARALLELGCSKVKLITNDPKKIQELEKNGICVAERIKLTYNTNKIVEKYLRAKKDKLGHYL